jgi:hypothetical protein
LEESRRPVESAVEWGVYRLDDRVRESVLKRDENRGDLVGDRVAKMDEGFDARALGLLQALLEKLDGFFERKLEDHSEMLLEVGGRGSGRWTHSA